MMFGGKKERSQYFWRKFLNFSCCLEGKKIIDFLVERKKITFSDPDNDDGDDVTASPGMMITC